MYKDFKNILIEMVGKELNNNDFYLVDSSKNHFIYHRKCESFIEIIQFGKDKYETCITISVSIVFLNVLEEMTNINYPFFREFGKNNIEKISADDCLDKYFIKGNFGNNFHYGNVYLVLGRGICGINPNAKKPVGIRLKKYNSKTYEKLCITIIKRLKKAYYWLDKKKKAFTN